MQCTQSNIRTKMKLGQYLSVGGLSVWRLCPAFKGALVTLSSGIKSKFHYLDLVKTLIKLSRACSRNRLRFFHTLETSRRKLRARCNPWPHVANRHISVSQLLWSCCYLVTVSNSGLLSVQRPRTASHAHFRHSHITELICGVNSSTRIEWHSDHRRHFTNR